MIILLAVILVLLLLLIYYYFNNKKESTSFIINNKICFLQTTNKIYHVADTPLKKAYLINLTKYNNNYLQAVNSEKTIKINVLPYFANCDQKEINYSWKKLADDMKTDLTDSILIFEFN